MKEIKDYLVSENYGKCFKLLMKNGETLIAQVACDLPDEPLEFFEVGGGWCDDSVSLRDIEKVISEFDIYNDDIQEHETADIVSDYNRGYEDALRAIRVNLEHFKKGVWSIEMIYEGCSMDRYEGESECEKLLFSEILGVNK